MYHRDVTFCLKQIWCVYLYLCYVYFSHIILLECFTKCVKAENDISLSTNRLAFSFKAQSRSLVEQLKICTNISSFNMDT